jgi:hypothetical protein
MWTWSTLGWANAEKSLTTSATPASMSRWAMFSMFLAPPRDASFYMSARDPR